MLTGHFFKRLSHQRSFTKLKGRCRPSLLLTAICSEIVRTFARTGYPVVVAALLDLEKLGEDESSADYPLAHPECDGLQGSDYCHESWQLHLVELNRQPETHWHRCDCAKRCAIVPLVVNGRCRAAFRLVCPLTIPERDFETNVELLDLLVRNAILEVADDLSRLFPPDRSRKPANRRRSATQRGSRSSSNPPSHPQVLKALAYVEHELSDPKLSVGHVAGALGMHSDYLGHLFAKHVGQRMREYIAVRRIERAKILLATTNWPVKRVARETGFANVKWFYHVFQTYAGLTPGTYRRRAESRNTDRVRFS